MNIWADLPFNNKGQAYLLAGSQPSKRSLRGTSRFLRLKVQCNHLPKEKVQYNQKQHMTQQMWLACPSSDRSSLDKTMNVLWAIRALKAGST